MDKGPEAPARAADFKTGLGTSESATQRRADKEGAKVKRERNNRLAKQRGGGPAGATQGGSASFSDLLPRYNKAALLATGDLEQLRILNALLGTGIDAELEHHLPALLLDDQSKEPRVLNGLLVILTQMEAGAPDAQERVALSLGCLVNLTGAETSHAMSCVNLVVQRGFLRFAETVLRPQTEETLRNELAIDVWFVLANLVGSSPEMRDAVLLANHDLSLIIARSLALCQQGAPDFCEHHPVLSSRLLRVASNSMACGPFLPTGARGAALVQLIWGCCSMIWMRCFQAPMKERDGGLPEWLLNSCTNALYAITYRAPAAQLELLQRHEGGAQFLAFVVRAIPRLCTPNYRLKAARLLVAVGLLNVEGTIFQRCMMEAGAIPVMRALVVDEYERVAREAVLWLGNLAAESSLYVVALLEAGGFSEIQRQLQTPRSAALVDNCLRALMSAIKSCLLAGAGEPLQALLWGDLRCVHLMAVYVDRDGKNDITIEILGIWLSLLKLHPIETKALLEESGALERVNKLMGSQDPRIYKLAEAIDERCAGVQDDMDDAEEEGPR